MSVGKIGPFDVSKDNWDLYVDRLEQYFIANDVKPAVKVATLITVMGGDAYELMVNLCTPVKPSQRTFEELVTVMKEHLQPKPSLLAERFKFRRCIQKHDESIADYVTELKKLTKHCRFTPEHIKENLRDQFVCGLSSEMIRQRLFTEDDITFDKAFKLAVAMEAAEADAAFVQERAGGCGAASAQAESAGAAGRASEGAKLYKITAAGTRANSRRSGGRPSNASATFSGGGPSGIGRASGGDGRNASLQLGKSNFGKEECSVCGRRHSSVSCKFKNYVCRVCNQIGHLRNKCPNLRPRATIHRVSHEEVMYSDSSADSSDEFQIQ